MTERKIVVPGETIISGKDFLPGFGTRRDKDDIVANVYGLSETVERLVKVIPLAGTFVPRQGNSVIGMVTEINNSGWVLDLGSSISGFLSVREVPRYINNGEFREFLDFGELVFAKIFETKGGRYIDTTIKLRGYGKLEDGMIVKINPNKVPRIIGKEGSMVSMIKDATGCEINVGQNGWIWVKGANIDAEIKTKKIIEFICEHSFIEGLTDKAKEFMEKLK